MQTMTRAEAADKLIDLYAGYFDISPAQEEQAPLVATCDFHAHSEKYVLSRKAKLWEAGSHEYVPVFCAPSDGGYLQLLPGLCLGAWHG